MVMGIRERDELIMSGIRGILDLFEFLSTGILRERS